MIHVEVLALHGTDDMIHSNQATNVVSLQLFICIPNQEIPVATL